MDINISNIIIERLHKRAPHITNKKEDCTYYSVIQINVSDQLFLQNQQNCLFLINSVSTIVKARHSFVEQILMNFNSILNFQLIYTIALNLNNAFQKFRREVIIETSAIVIEKMAEALKASPNASQVITIHFSQPSGISPDCVTLLKTTTTKLMPSFNIVELNEKQMTFNMQNKRIKLA